MPLTMIYCLWIKDYGLYFSSFLVNRRSYSDARIPGIGLYCVWMNGERQSNGFDYWIEFFFFLVIVVEPRTAVIIICLHKRKITAINEYKSKIIDKILESILTVDN